MTGRERSALLAVAAIAAVTAAWWSLALWPLPSDAPYWLVRTREVCFGALPDSLPRPDGWLLLIGQPLSMLAALAIIWPRELAGGLAALPRTGSGRAVLGLGALLLFAAAAAASARIASATGRDVAAATYTAPPPSTYPRLDRDAPPLGLVDQHGDTVSLGAFRGRLVLVTFAYAHCASICPTVVHEVLDAQHQLGAARAAVVVVTLDPWRDTPARLPAVADQWQLGAEAHVLSGDTASVLRALDAWNVPHERHLDSGEIAHPSIVFLLGRDGRIAYASTAHADAIVTLAHRIG